MPDTVIPQDATGDSVTTEPPSVTARAVTAQGLHKRFGETVAVDGIDLTVPRGSTFGVVGPNGAGKTTFLRCATGLLRPDAGAVTVEGSDVWRDPVAARRLVGVLPEDLQLFERLTGAQLLSYTGELFGLPRGEAARRAGELLELLDLTADARTLVVDYSQGMRKKVGLAAALIHSPSVLFLDEPFESIDPVSGRTIRMLLRRHAEAGGTVILSSHVMELVEHLCDHVAVIHRGRVVAAGLTEEVAGGQPLHDAFAHLVEADTDSEVSLSWLRPSRG